MRNQQDDRAFMIEESNAAANSLLVIGGSVILRVLDSTPVQVNILEFNDVYLVVGDVSVDSKTLLVTSLISRICKCLSCTG